MLLGSAASFTSQPSSQTPTRRPVVRRRLVLLIHQWRPRMQIKNANPPIQVTGRHVSVTEAMKEYCRRKVTTLHLDYPKIIEAQVILDVQKYRHLAEVILHCSNHITIEASAVSSDMYASIDQVVDRIGRQMRKYKTRLMQNHRPRKQAIRHLEEKILRWEWTEPMVNVDAAISAEAALPATG